MIEYTCTVLKSISATGIYIYICDRRIYNYITYITPPPNSHQSIYKCHYLYPPPRCAAATCHLPFILIRAPDPAVKTYFPFRFLPHNVMLCVAFAAVCLFVCLCICAVLFTVGVSTTRRTGGLNISIVRSSIESLSAVSGISASTVGLKNTDRAFDHKIKKRTFRTFQWLPFQQHQSMFSSCSLQMINLGSTTSKRDGIYLR